MLIKGTFYLKCFQLSILSECLMSFQVISLEKIQAGSKASRIRLNRSTQEKRVAYVGEQKGGNGISLEPLAFRFRRLGVISK